MTSCARSTDGCRGTATSTRRSTSASGRWEYEMATIEDFFLERYEQLELDLDARQDLEDAARDLALRRAREHLEYVEERERREAEREKEQQDEQR